MRSTRKDGSELVTTYTVRFVDAFDLLAGMLTTRREEVSLFRGEYVVVRNSPSIVMNVQLFIGRMRFPAIYGLIRNLPPGLLLGSAGGPFISRPHRASITYMNNYTYNRVTSFKIHVSTTYKPLHFLVPRSCEDARYSQVAEPQ